MADSDGTDPKGAVANASMHSAPALRFLIPDGIADFSPGSRSVSDENPVIPVVEGFDPGSGSQIT